MTKRKIKNTDERVRFIESAAGFLTWCAENDSSTELQLETLTHDICGLAREEEYFLPRVSRYGQYWKG